MPKSMPFAHRHFHREQLSMDDEWWPIVVAFVGQRFHPRGRFTHHSQVIIKWFGKPFVQATGTYIHTLCRHPRTGLFRYIHTLRRVDRLYPSRSDSRIQVDFPLSHAAETAPSPAPPLDLDENEHAIRRISMPLITMGGFRGSRSVRVTVLM